MTTAGASTTPHPNPPPSSSALSLRDGVGREQAGASGEVSTAGCRLPALDDIPWWTTEQGVPPLGVVVVVRWRDAHGLREFEAARARHPETGALLWLTHYRGRPVWLPPVNVTPADPSRAWAGFHALRGRAPELWRPKRPDLWAHPLPAPALVEPAPGSPRAVAEGRMWSATCLLARSDSPPGSRPERASAQVRGDMSATEIAREMEEMREAAHAAHRLGEDGQIAAEPQWWLDPHLVTYSEPGRISRREAEGRLMRALATDRALSLGRPVTKTFADTLARAALPAPCEPDRFQPTGPDLDDHPVAMAWLVDLARRRRRVRRDLPRWVSRRRDEERTVLEERAALPAKAWAKIAAAAKVKPGEVEAVYVRALDRVTAVANGAATPGVLARAAALAAVQEGNRAWKRGALLVAPSDTRSARRPEGAFAQAGDVAELALSGVRLTRRQCREVALRAASAARARKEYRAGEVAAEALRERLARQAERGAKALDERIARKAEPA